MCITRDDRYMQVDYVFFYILVYARFVLPILFYSFRLDYIPQKSSYLKNGFDDPETSPAVAHPLPAARWALLRLMSRQQLRFVHVVFGCLRGSGL